MKGENPNLRMHLDSIRTLIGLHEDKIPVPEALKLQVQAGEERFGLEVENPIYGIQYNEQTDNLIIPTERGGNAHHQVNHCSPSLKRLLLTVQNSLAGEELNTPEEVQKSLLGS